MGLGEQPRAQIVPHVDHKHSGLHGHKLVKLGNDLVVGGRRRNHAPVRDERVDIAEGIDEGGNDSVAVVGVGVDGDHFSPGKGFDERAYGFDLGGVVGCGSEEIRAPRVRGG